MKRYSLDKAAPGMFENNSGGWVKYQEAEDAIASERERIADLWAGCTTEADGHGLVDIGASIRAGKLVDAP